MNITRKRLTLVPYERNCVEKIDSRAIYAMELSRIRDENLIFLDEASFNQHTTRSYGYSLENTKIFTIVPGNRNTNRSLLCAISNHGVVTFDYRIGAYNVTNFIAFIENKLVPYFILNPSKILIMDNARIHHSQLVVNTLRSNNIVFKFLVPYSPELNPVEEFFL
jgi:hypothetical protein